MIMIGQGLMVFNSSVRCNPGQKSLMLRQARIDFPGALHHIMVRGLNRTKIFKSDAKKVPPKKVPGTFHCALTEGELAAVRRCVRRGQPFESNAWSKQTAQKMGVAVNHDSLVKSQQSAISVVDLLFYHDLFQQDTA